MIKLLLQGHIGHNMRLPSFKRIFKDDYKEEDKDMISQLAGSLNIALESLFNLSRNKANLLDNIDCTVGDINIEVDSNGKPSSITTLSLRDGQNGVLGLSVINILNNTDNTNYAAPTQVSFNVLSGKIQITAVKGLTAGTNYTLRLIIWSN